MKSPSSLSVNLRTERSCAALQTSRNFVFTFPDDFEVEERKERKFDELVDCKLPKDLSKANFTFKSLFTEKDGHD